MADALNGAGEGYNLSVLIPAIITGLIGIGTIAMQGFWKAREAQAGGDAEQKKRFYDDLFKELESNRKELDETQKKLLEAEREKLALLRQVGEAELKASRLEARVSELEKQMQDLSAKL
jgi:predicted nuclease with TOPRIM domain